MWQSVIVPHAQAFDSPDYDVQPIIQLLVLGRLSIYNDIHQVFVKKSICTKVQMAS